MSLQNFTTRLVKPYILKKRVKIETSSLTNLWLNLIRYWKLKNNYLLFKHQTKNLLSKSKARTIEKMSLDQPITDTLQGMIS
jgi:hypothetical protein